MLSVLPTSTPAPEDSSTPTGAEVTALLEISDPWRRLALAAQGLSRIEAQLTAIRAVRRDTVAELVHQHRTPLSRVAAFIGLTKARVGQLAQEALRAAQAERWR
jgi:signal transduction histidine kinase